MTFQDVVLAASASLIVAAIGDDPDFWADSESDFELSNFDPEIGPKSSESWKCVQCGCANTPYIRYCGQCWEVRTQFMLQRCLVSLVLKSTALPYAKFE